MGGGFSPLPLQPISPSGIRNQKPKEDTDEEVRFKQKQLSKNLKFRSFFVIIFIFTDKHPANVMSNSHTLRGKT